MYVCMIGIEVLGGCVARVEAQGSVETKSRALYVKIKEWARKGFKQVMSLGF